MFYLGLLLPICFVPGYTGAAIPTQWAVLTVAGAIGLWRKGTLSLPLWLGLSFLLFGLLAVSWSVNRYDSVYGLWLVIVWLLSLWLGLTASDLAQLWKGLALGLSISSLVAIFQSFGYQPLPTFSGGNTGLLFNSTLLSACMVLVILGLISINAWAYIPALLPGLYLAHSRGGWLVLTMALVAKYLHWTLAIAVFLTAAWFFSTHLDPSNSERLRHWHTAYNHLTLLGWGPGTFVDYWYSYNSTMIHPEYVHNDPLQLWFEFGLGAIPVYCLFAWALTRTSSPAWPILFAFATYSLFYFPLWCPIPSFLGFLVAGHLLRGGPGFLDLWDRCRSYLPPWRPYREQVLADPSRQNLPLELPHSL